MTAPVWMVKGTEHFLAALDLVHDLGRPSLLQGWTRKHLVAHVAANAEALLNLVRWARTGEPTPMYASPEQRTADIERGAVKPDGELRAWVRDSAERLADGLAALTEEQWAHPVRTAQGRLVPASEVPWMRSREVLIHAVDLDAGLTFVDLPEDFLAALVDDIAAKRSHAADGPALAVRTTDGARTWSVTGSGSPVAVTGTLPELAAYLAGRRSLLVAAPALPRWL
jgi:maleylpyruvate isomerase